MVRFFSHRFIHSPLLLSLALLMQVLVAQTGRVVGYDANRIGDYDGFRIQTRTGEISLRFPPHTAAVVRQLAAVGQTVTIQTEAVPGPGGNALRLVSLQNNRTRKQTRIAELPPPPPQVGKLIDLDEPLTGTRADAQGQLVALLTTTYLIELKPHQSEPLQAILTGVKRIKVTGYERTARGFVNQSGLRLLHPTALTIDGQTFAF